MLNEELYDTDDSELAAERERTRELTIQSYSST
ncbi:maltose acetyltransferase domain-containing protein [Haloarcula nitratireducens]